MRDQRLDKLADVLVKYSTEVRPGDEVAIISDPVAMPLVEATFEAVLRAGGHPYFLPRPERFLIVLYSAPERDYGPGSAKVERSLSSLEPTR